MVMLLLLFLAILLNASDVNIKGVEVTSISSQQEKHGKTTNKLKYQDSNHATGSYKYRWMDGVRNHG